MERREGAQTPYEVYCYSCKASFAVGTRKCVHCGGRLAGAEGPGPLEALGTADEGLSGSEADMDASPVLAIVRRLSGAALWVVFVVLAMLARMCEGQ